MKIRLSNSKIDSGEACMYKLYLESLRKIVPRAKSSALLHGSAWHVIMEHFYKHIKANGWNDTAGAVTAAGVAAKEFWDSAYKLYDVYADYRNLSTEMEMFIAYLTHFTADQGFLAVTSTEEKLECTIPLDVIAGPLVDEITYSGVIDLRCTISGVPWIIDHKTTAAYMQKVIDGLNRSFQFIGYSYLEREHYAEAEGSMANIAKCSARKKKDGEWGKKAIDFARPVQVYADDDYDIFVTHVNEFASRVAQCLYTDTWPKNYSACYNFGRCRYYTQCVSNSHDPVEGYMLNPEEGSELTY